MQSGGENGHAGSGSSALSELVDEDKRLGGGLAEDGSHLDQVDLKGALRNAAGFDAVDSRENLVVNANLCLVAGDEAAKRREGVRYLLGSLRCVEMTTHLPICAM